MSYEPKTPFQTEGGLTYNLKNGTNDIGIRVTSYSHDEFATHEVAHVIRHALNKYYGFTEGDFQLSIRVWDRGLYEEVMIDLTENGIIVARLRGKTRTVTNNKFVITRFEGDKDPRGTRRAIVLTEFMKLLETPSQYLRTQTSTSVTCIFQSEVERQDLDGVHRLWGLDFPHDGEMLAPELFQKAGEVIQGVHYEVDYERKPINGQ